MDFNSTFERREAIARILKNKPYVTTKELAETLSVKSYIISKDRKYISQHIELFNNAVHKNDNEMEDNPNDSSVTFPDNTVFKDRKVKVAYLMMEYYYTANRIVKILGEPSYTIYRDMRYVREHYDYFRKMKNNNWTNTNDGESNEKQWRDSKLTRLRFKVYKILCDNGDMSSSKIADILNVSWKKVNTAKKFINSHIELFQDIPYEQVKRLAKGVSITIRNKKYDSISKDELEPESSIFNMGKSNNILFNNNRRSTNVDEPTNNNHPNPFLM